MYNKMGKNAVIDLLATARKMSPFIDSSYVFEHSLFVTSIDKAYTRI